MDYQAVASARSVQNRGVDRWFYIDVAAVTILTVIAGFAPSLVNTAGRKAPVTSLIAAHGVLNSVWLTVFLAQTIFAATRRIPLHRRLGMAAMFLAPVLILTGYATAIAMARRGYDLSGDIHIQADPLLALVNPLGDLVIFALLLVMGFLYRHRRDIHKRVMLLATVGGMMPAPLAHLIGHYNAAPRLIMIPIALFLFANAAYDRISFGRVHPVSLWGGLAIFVSLLLLNFIVGPSAAWHHLARWLVG
jgi:hypothetical protein